MASLGLIAPTHTNLALHTTDNQNEVFSSSDSLQTCPNKNIQGQGKDDINIFFSNHRKNKWIQMSSPFSYCRCYGEHRHFQPGCDSTRQHVWNRTSQVPLYKRNFHLKFNFSFQSGDNRWFSERRLGLCGRQRIAHFWAPRDREDSEWS